MKKLLFLSFLVLGLTSTAQTSDNELPSLATFNFGRSFHGTGDLPGFNYGISYTNQVSKRWFWNVVFNASLHEESGRPFIWEDPEGNSYDSTLHTVTGGFQLGLGYGFNFINSSKHRLGVNVDAFGRYQATSLNDTEEIQYPALTGFPVPIRFILNTEPFQTFAVGGAFNLFYDYKIKSRFTIGIMGSTQYDTNNDIIHYASLRLGFVLK